MVAQLKLGIRIGSQELAKFSYLAKLGASVVLPAYSGRFVVCGTSTGYHIAIATSAAAISGYIEESLTSSSTAGVTQLPLCTNIDMVEFELPYATGGAAATLTDAVLNTTSGGLVGKTCDAYVDTNGIQYANVSSNSQGVFLITGGSVANNTIFVRVPNAKIGQAAL